jgi:DNA mismatch repair protein MutS2
MIIHQREFYCGGHMPRYIDKHSDTALQTDILLECIQPVSEPGRKLKMHEKIYLPGEEKELTAEFQMIHLLMNFKTQQPGDFIVLQDLLAHIEDIHGTIKHCESHNLPLHEIFEIKQFLYHVIRICEILRVNSLDEVEIYDDFINLFEYLDQDKQNQPHFYLSDAYSPDLAMVRNDLNILTNAEKKWFYDTRRKAEKALGIQMVGLEVVIDRTNASQQSKVEKSPYFQEGKSNFNNRVFHLKETPDLLETRSKIQTLKKKIEKLELIVRTQVSKKLAPHAKSLASALNMLALLDLRMAKATFGIENGCCIPKITRKKQIQLEGVINLPLQKQLSELGLNYEEIDINLVKNVNIVVGANMAGKTSALKCVGQVSFLAARSIPIPASSARLPLFDFLFYSGEDGQRKQPDLSSFAQDVVAMQDALDQKGLGLFLIDEFARGTNPIEGEALCTALLSYMILKNAFTFSATHFQAPASIREAGHFLMPGLTEADFKAISKLPSKERIAELHKRMKYQLMPITKGQKTPLAALRIAEILGLDLEIILQANDQVTGDRE